MFLSNDDKADKKVCTDLALKVLSLSCICSHVACLEICCWSAGRPLHLRSSAELWFLGRAMAVGRGSLTAREQTLGSEAAMNFS